MPPPSPPPPPPPPTNPTITLFTILVAFQPYHCDIELKSFSEGTINNIPENTEPQPSSTSTSISTRTSSGSTIPLLTSMSSTSTSIVSLSSSSISTTLSVEPSTTSLQASLNGDPDKKYCSHCWNCPRVLDKFLKTKSKPNQALVLTIPELDSDTSGYLTSPAHDEKEVLTEPTNSDSNLSHGLRSRSESYLTFSEPHPSPTESSPISPSTTHQTYITEDSNDVRAQLRELEGAITTSNDVQDLRAALSVIVEQIRRSNGHDLSWTREFMDEPPPEYVVGSQ
ncbi:hypothetical protein K435DRAFT_972996 [Dendrothele bispora CBS 962.96]|uniref:Uncharacterized protein n=1 Tax=Dendrothele bispora (strain CBS 962.96) TaxID=1314807 RepID=A0A4S8KVE1_DENBC|nr:hypothetical protein K435DRAFT_972996 [Dendrothele bispora CBS 962.96]